MHRQPIASAPRDGRNIIVFFGQDGVSQAKYIAGLPYPWQFIDADNNGVSWLINHAVDGPGGPSHWMPMPDFADTAPPAAVPAPDVSKERSENFGELAVVREFQEWLNERRMHDVSYCLHEIVDRFRRLAEAAAPAQAVDALPTDLSKRLRDWADNKPLAAHYADIMRNGADEIERYYGGMVNWKRTAEAKDQTIADLRAALAAQPAAPAKPTHHQIMDGYEVACRYGVYENRAFKLAEEMFAAMCTTAAPAGEPVAVPDELNAIGHLLRTQDNRYTDQPMFVVQQRRRITGIDTGYCDNIVWLHAEGDYTEADATEHAELESEFKESGRERKGWIRTGYNDVWEFVTACFTEQGCKDYIARDGHNLKEPRIYAEGSYRNEEFRAVRNWLMSLHAPVANAGLALTREQVWAAFSSIPDIPDGLYAQVQHFLKHCKAPSGQAQAVAVPSEEWLPKLEYIFRRIDHFRLCMSYNDSYFGEPKGLLKGCIAEMAHMFDGRRAAAPLPQQVAQTEAKPFPTSRGTYGKMTPEQKQRLDADLDQLGQRIDEHRKSRDRRTHSEVVEFDRRRKDRRQRSED